MDGRPVVEAPAVVAKLTASLVSGLTLSVLTAWAIAVVVQFAFIDSGRVASPNVRISAHGDHHWAYTQKVSLTGYQELSVTYRDFPADGVDDMAHPAWSVVSQPDPDKYAQSRPMVYELAAGFPFKGFSGKRDGMGSSVVPLTSWAIQLPFAREYFNFRGAAILPLKPHWPGMMLNTLSYGLLWWLLIPFVRKSMVALHVRRCVAQGRCVTRKCGYSLGGLTTCPECGTEQPVQCAAATE